MRNYVNIAWGKVFVAFYHFSNGEIHLWAYKNFFERWQGVAIDL